MQKDKGKGTFYFPTNILEQMQAEAERQDRSLSWIVQQAMKIALPELRKMPAAATLLEQAMSRTG